MKIVENEVTKSSIQDQNLQLIVRTFKGGPRSSDFLLVTLTATRRGTYFWGMSQLTGTVEQRNRGSQIFAREIFSGDIPCGFIGNQSTF